MILKLQMFVYQSVKRFVIIPIYLCVSAKNSSRTQTQRSRKDSLMFFLAIPNEIGFNGGMFPMAHIRCLSTMRKHEKTSEKLF